MRLRLSDRGERRLILAAGMLPASKATGIKAMARAEALEAREDLRGDPEWAQKILAQINELPEPDRADLKAAVDWLEDYEKHEREFPRKPNSAPLNP